MCMKWVVGNMSYTLDLIVFSIGIIGFFFQAEDGIRDFCLSRGLGDVYKRQVLTISLYL